MYRIVAGIDTDTDRAEGVGRTLAEMPFEEAEVVLVHVFEENPEGAGVGQVGSVSHVEKILTERADFEVTPVGKSGDPAAGLLDTAEEFDANLLCVAGRKRTPTGKAIFGSVTQDVILDSTYPVVVCDDQWPGDE